MYGFLNKIKFKVVLFIIFLVLLTLGIFCSVFWYKSSLVKEEQKPAIEYNKVPDYVQENIKEKFGANTIIPTNEEEAEEVKKDKNSIGIISIPLKSLPNALMISQESWMLPMEKYDQQLTELEELQKKDYESKDGEARYAAIIASANLSNELISKLGGSIEKGEQNKIYLKKDKERLQNFLYSLDERTTKYGYSGVFTEDVVKKIKKNFTDTIGIIEDVERMTDVLITVKKGTINQINNKDALKALFSAQDEDTVSLVLGWHEEGYQRLSNENNQMIADLQSQLNSNI